MVTTTNLIRTVTIRAKSEGFAQATSDTKGLAAAGDEVVASSSRQEKATLSVERAYQRLQTQLDSTFKSEQQMARAVETLARAQAQGLVTAERAADLTALAAQQYSKSGAAVSDMARKMSESSGAFDKLASSTSKGSAGFNDMIRGMSSVGRAAQESTDASKRMVDGMSGIVRANNTAATSTEKLANVNKLARFELVNLSRQVQDVGVSLASGQNAFTVFIQQGSQIFDVFQSSGVTIGGFARQLVGMINPMVAAGVAIAALVAGAALLVTSLANSEKAFLNLSERVDTPIAKLRELQAALEVRGGGDMKAFTSGMEQFSQQVALAQQGLGNLAELFRLNGMAAGDVNTSLEQVADLLSRAQTGAEKVQIALAAGIPVDWIRALEGGAKSFQDLQGSMVQTNAEAEKLALQARAFDEAWAAAWKNFTTNAQNAAFAAFSFLGTLIDKAGAFIVAQQLKFRSLADIGAGALAGGQGTQLDQAGADAFYRTVNTGQQRQNDLQKQGNQIATDGRTITLENVKAREKVLQQENDHIRLLGKTATLDQQRQMKSNEIELAALRGVKLTEQETKNVLAQVGATKEHSKKVKELKEDYSAVQNAVTSFASTLIDGMLNGASATETLGKAVQGLGKQITSVGLGDFAKDISKSITGFLPDLGGLLGGALGGLATAGIGVGISLIGKLFGGGDSAAEKKLQEDQKRAAEELQRAKEAWAGMADEVQAFNRAAAGLKLGALTSSIADLFKQAEPLIAAAAKAGETAGSLDVSRTLSQGIDRLLANFQRDVERLVSEFGTTGPLAEARKQVDQITDEFESLSDSLREFGLRTGAVAYVTEKAIQLQDRFVDAILALVDAGEELSEIGKQVADVKAKAFVMQQALTELGIAAEVAAGLIDTKLNTALKRLTDAFINDLVRQINTLNNGEWINQADDLRTKVAQMRNDAAQLGIQTSLINEFLIRSTQEIIDSNELTGNSFLSLVRMMNLADAGLHAFIDTTEEAAASLVRSAQEIADAIQANEDRLFNAIHNSDSLADQLARFDLAAQREREAEIRAGGQALASLERALAQERVNIITAALAQQAAAGDAAADAAQQAAEAAARALQEAVDFIEDQVKRIHDFISDFLSGPDSILKPSQQLAEAQAHFAAELALASSGNRDALQNITGNAQNVIDAVRRYYGSSAAGQGLIQNVIGTLEGLPAMLSPEEFIVQAIDDLGGTVTDVTQDQTDVLAALLDGIRLALQSGDAQAFAIALQPAFDRLDTTMDHALSFEELTQALGNDINLNTLRSIFTTLDTNGDQLLQQSELNTAATQGVGNSVQQSLTLLDYLRSIDFHVSFCDHLATMRGSLIQIAAWIPGQSHARGGMVAALGGPLSGRSHSQGGIPIVAEGGEYIVNKTDTAWARSTLDAINYSHGLPANDNGVITAIGRLERSLLRGFKAMIDAELQAAGIIAKPSQEANRLMRSRRGEKKVA